MTTRPDACTVLRIARPVADLASARRFWVDALGMTVQFEKPDDEHGGALVMCGFAQETWHLELVQAASGAEISAAPEGELLVLYLGDEPDPELLDALTAAGGRIVPGDDYWSRWGVTIEDPDGRPLVLCHRSWR